MWDYDKLFAKENVVGVKNCYKNFIYNQIIDFNENSFWVDCFQNNELSCKNQYVINDEDGSEYTTDFEIQYIIRLDEHGNVVEKLFDRDRDMPEPMPELETGMFVRVKDEGLGYVDTINNRIVYQHGRYDVLDGDEYLPKITEVYSENACAFNRCNENVLIWRDHDYQAYLDLIEVTMKNKEWFIDQLNFYQNEEKYHGTIEPMAWDEVMYFGECLIDNYGYTLDSLKDQWPILFSN